MVFSQATCLTPGRITVQVKTPKEKQAVEVEEGASVKQVSSIVGRCRGGVSYAWSRPRQCPPLTSLAQFKEAISAKFSGAPVENLCLIFAGKIMKDQETLATHNVKVKQLPWNLDPWT